MLYDARRTLGRLFFEYDRYGAAGLRCAELCAAQHKGYFQARREGANLRIFVDRILKPQPW